MTETPDDFSSVPLYTRYERLRDLFFARREALWPVLCRYLQRFIPRESVLLDLGAGHCHFINHIEARERHALDILPGFQRHAAPGVTSHVRSCLELAELGKPRFDVVFASNLFEHLTRAEFPRCVEEVRRALKPGGRLIVLQPNFKYCPRQYFDDPTHTDNIHTHVSLGLYLSISGFRVERVIPRLLPFSARSPVPFPPALLALYLRLPIRPFSSQMLLIAQRE